METKTNIYKSLAAFQYEVPVIHKGTKAFKYTYTTLTDIFKVINPLLEKHGLGFTQLLQGDSIETVIFHIESGESITSVVNIPQGVQLANQNQFQVLGSAITYLRRYAISAALCLVTDADLDACGDQVSKEEIQVNTPTEEEKAMLRSLVYGTGYDDERKSNAFRAIEDCNNYKMYEKIQHQLENEQLPIDQIPNPNQTDIKKHIKKVTG
jgi:hypothetical protein